MCFCYDAIYYYYYDYLSLKSPVSLPTFPGSYFSILDRAKKLNCKSLMLLVRLPLNPAVDLPYHGSYWNSNLFWKLLVKRPMNPAANLCIINVPDIKTCVNFSQLIIVYFN